MHDNELSWNCRLKLSSSTCKVQAWVLFSDNADITEEPIHAFWRYYAHRRNNRTCELTLMPVLVASLTAASSWSNLGLKAIVNAQSIMRPGKEKRSSIVVYTLHIVSLPGQGTSCPTDTEAHHNHSRARSRQLTPFCLASPQLWLPAGQPWCNSLWLTGLKAPTN